MSAERGSRPRRVFRRALLALVLATACTLNTASDVGITSARYMDELCASNSYELTGNAVRTSGISADSCGFVLGPGPGSVSFNLVIPEDAAAYAVSALIAQGGTTRWVELESAYTAGADAGAVRPERFTASTGGDTMNVLDVRFTEEHADCSIARHPRRLGLFR